MVKDHFYYILRRIVEFLADYVKGVLYPVNDRLLTFLKACDRNRYFDLAGQALTLAITRLTPPNETLPQSIAKAHPREMTALQKLKGGYDITRADLRDLAELENALENPDDPQDAGSPEKEALRAVIASISGSLPRATQARLARSMGDSGDDTSCFLPRKGLSPAGWYAGTATTAFTIVMGLSALPAAISYNGNAWATALIPLAIVALLVYLLYRNT